MWATWGLYSKCRLHSFVEMNGYSLGCRGQGKAGNEVWILKASPEACRWAQGLQAHWPGISLSWQPAHGKIPASGSLGFQDPLHFLSPGVGPAV